MTVDINCDLGEGVGNDAAIMPFISSANIACGFHAGDEISIRETIILCKNHGVAIGAHPGFDDKENFGRVPVDLPDNEIYQLVWHQLQVIQQLCEEFQAPLHHVKPHGALYNMAAKDRSLSAILARVVFDFNPRLFYYGLSGSCMIEEAERCGLRALHEAFADRTYSEDGSLTPRSLQGAVIENVQDAITQVGNMIAGEPITCQSGGQIFVKADTICIHGDGEQAPALVRQLYRHLKSAGIEVSAP